MEIALKTLELSSKESNCVNTKQSQQKFVNLRQTKNPLKNILILPNLHSQSPKSRD